MIPLSLTIQGIYSYEKEYTIDFKDLASEGVFGIFGKVGSGKSAIVEAISVALYGRTERYAVSGMAANILNLNSDLGKIIFTFNNFKGDTYQTTTRLVPRKGDKKDVRRDFKILKLVQEEWQVCEESIEEIIGLNYANFKRTILIPQGQFREFIELKPSEKNQMMQELFQLDRFDLFGNTTRLLSITKEEKQYSQGVLSQLQPFMDVNVEEEEKSIQENTLKVNALQKETSEKEKALKLLEDQYASWLKWKEVSAKLKALEAQKNNMKTLEENIKRQERFQMYIKSPYLQWKDSITQQKELKNQNQQTHDAIEILATNFKTLEVQQKILQEKEASWPKRKEQIKQYDYLIGIIKLSTDLSSKAIEIDKITVQEKQLKTDWDILNLKIKATHESADGKEKQLIAPEQLLSIQKAFQELDFYNKEKHRLEQLIKEQKQSLKTIETYFKTHELNLNDWKATLENRLSVLQTEEKSKVSILHHLKVHAALEQFSEHLQEGEACMLCGALEHPKPLEAHPEKTLADMQSIEEKINTIQTHFNQLRNVLLTCELKNKSHSEHQQKIQELTEELFLILEKSKAHIGDTSIWNHFQPNEENLFNQKLQEAQKTRTEWMQLREEIKKLTNTKEELQSNLQNLQERLQPLNSVSQQLEGRIQNGKEMVDSLPLEWIDSKNETVLSSEKEALKLQVEKEELQWQNINKEIQENQKQKHGLSEIANKQQQDLEVLVLRHEQLKFNLEESMKQYEFLDMDELEQLLNSTFSLEKSKMELATYQSEYEKWLFQSQQFDENIQQFNVVNLEQAKLATKNIQEVLKQANHELLLKIEKLKEIKSKQISFQKEFKQLQKVEARANNLSTLAELFKGKKFVEYASAYWLKRLVHNSNNYFEKLTHNQLSLQLNEDLEFEIVDYLNGGQTRVLRTLSGGQSFQVSLSLALALAEGVQSNFNASEQFFFIDEGFGTLDDDAIQQVYDTLTKLISDKRKIGIISHVTGLQEQVPRHLKIVKKEEGGSLLTLC